MMKRLSENLLFFLLFFLFSNVIGQQNRDKVGDSLKKYSVDVLIQKCYSDVNPKIYCDEMFSRELSDEEKTKCYNILALKYYFETLNDYDKAIHYFNLSNLYAKKTGNITFEKTNLNTIAVIYALQNKLSNSIQVLKKRNRLKSLDKTDEIQELLSGGDDDAIYALLGNFDKSIKSYQLATEKIDKYLAKHTDISSEKKYQLAFYQCMKYKNIFLSYNYKKELDSAKIYLNKIKNSSILPKDKSDIISCIEADHLILSGNLDEAIKKALKDKNDYKDDKARVYYNQYYLARAYQLKGNYKEALKYCQEGLNNIVINIDFVNIELELYRIAMLSAEKLGDENAYRKYSHLYEEANQKFNYKSKADFIAKLYDLDQIKPLEYKLNSSKKTTNYLWIIILLLVLLTIYFVNRFFVLRRYKKRFLEINAKLEQKEESKKKNESVKLIERNSLSSDTEKEILSKLEKFERKQQFLSPNISLSTLASNLNTNTSYLSSIIKDHKGNNFNGYINQLRIDYITLKLKLHPEYRQYKISYLAEECGFSSHTVFTRIFIDKTGIPPSKFIEYLNK